MIEEGKEKKSDTPKYLWASEANSTTGWDTFKRQKPVSTCLLQSTNHFDSTTRRYRARNLYKERNHSLSCDNRKCTPIPLPRGTVCGTGSPTWLAGWFTGSKLLCPLGWPVKVSVQNVEVSKARISRLVIGWWRKWLALGHHCNFFWTVLKRKPRLGKERSVRGPARRRPYKTTVGKLSISLASNNEKNLFGIT